MTIFDKNIGTNVAGIGGWIGTLMMLIPCFQGGHISWTCIAQVIFGGSVSTGLLLAKDAKVTGGTIPATMEAKARVTGHKSDPSDK